MEHESGKQNITIAEIAKRAGVSTATVSYVLSDRQDVKIGEETRGRILALCSELGYQKGAKRKTAAKKQITIDDIAREAGVSTATVSYIVNDRKDVKISEETRKKVLQICNLRQYTPSPVARLLAGKRSDLVGICAPHGGASGARYYALLQALQAALYRRGYGCVLLSCDGAREVRMQENPEGIFCIDLTEEEFYALKENCFVPIVAVDMMADDPLFFKAFVDHAALIAAAKEKLCCETVTYVAHPYRNAPYLDDLRAAMDGDTLFLVHSLSDLREYIMAHPEERYVFADTALSDACAPLPEAKQRCTVCYGDERTEGAVLRLSFCEMAEHAVDMLQSAVLREEDKPHTFRLAPKT